MWYNPTHENFKGYGFRLIRIISASVRASIRPLARLRTQARSLRLRIRTLSATALVSLLVATLFPQYAFAAGCAYDTSTSAAGAANATTLTYSFAPSASSNTTVVVGVNELQIGATPPSSVTYNGVAMTKVTNTHAANTAIDVSIWILYVGTADGAAHNVVVTGTAGTISLVSVAWSFTGTASTQTGASAVGGAASGTTGSATLTTTAANSCVAGMLFVNDSLVHTTPAAVSPTITDKQQDSDAGSGVQGDGGHQIAATVSSQTVSWTFASNLWEEAAVEVLGATASVQGFQLWTMSIF